jgi:hypothetical protein
MVEGGKGREGRAKNQISWEVDQRKEKYKLIY